MLSDFAVMSPDDAAGRGVFLPAAELNVSDSHETGQSFSSVAECHDVLEVFDA